MKSIILLAFVTSVAAVMQLPFDLRTAKPRNINVGKFSTTNVVQDASTNITAGTLIVGGVEITPHSADYLVALFITANGGTFFCGGVLISKLCVLTAAHCVAGQDVSGFGVFGAHDLSAYDPYWQVIGIHTIKKHPYYNPSTMQYDIAMITLSSPVCISETVKPIRLPKCERQCQTFAGQQATVTGWGITSDGSGSISPVPNEVTVPVITNTECNRLYTGFIVPCQMCTSGSGGRGACNGDSGGPLVIKDCDGKPTLEGIVSYGINLGCEVGYPTVYTRISGFMKWIHRNCDSLESCQCRHCQRRELKRW